MDSEDKLFKKQNETYPGGWSPHPLTLSVLLVRPCRVVSFRRRQTFLSTGEKSGPSPPPRAPSLDPRVRCGFLHWSCSGGNFLSLQLSEASPCPLLVSILSVAHGLGAPVRGPAISHRLALLLP